MEALTVERLKQANEIVKKIKLPVQPKVVIDINKEASGDEPDFKKIANLVSQDVGLSAKVLLVINSPFFGVSKEVTSIIQALSLMGMNNFNKVILTTCLREAIGSSSATEQVFWDHSLRVAVAGEKIASKCRSMLMIDNITPEQVYMAGLFHDSAIPICLGRAPEYSSSTTTALSHKSDIFQEEEDIIGTDHCCIGAMMAKSWSLSTDICKAILHHHASDYDMISKDKASTKLIATIQLADYIAYSFDYSVGSVDMLVEGSEDIDAWISHHALLLDELQIDPDDVNELKMEIFELFSE